MKYAIRLIYDNGQGAYLSVKGRSSWKTKRAAQQHYNICMQLLARDRFLKGVVAIELERDFFA